jgi:hypothetical protein
VFEVSQQNLLVVATYAAGENDRRLRTTVSREDLLCLLQLPKALGRDGVVDGQGEVRRSYGFETLHDDLPRLQTIR